MTSRGASQYGSDCTNWSNSDQVMREQYGNLQKMVYVPSVLDIVGSMESNKKFKFWRIIWFPISAPKHNYRLLTRDRINE